MNNLNNKKTEKSLFYEEKSLVGLTLVPKPSEVSLQPKPKP